MSDQNNLCSIRECINILKFIANLPENHKPCYNTLTSIDKNAWMVTFRRRWKREKGERGTEYIHKILDSCHNHYQDCLNREMIDQHTIDLLLQCLNNSLSGFNNLIETYNDQDNIRVAYVECKVKVNKLIKDIQDNITQNNNKVLVSGFFTTEGIVWFRT